MAKSVGMVCFVAAPLFSGCCLAQTIVGFAVLLSLSTGTLNGVTPTLTLVLSRRLIRLNGNA
jgi:hypothetical protein